jgi:hypothetical protein
MSVLTAPLALIKIDGKIIGKARNVRVSENFQRGSVMGIGRINPSELPVTGWSGSMTIGFYVVNFKDHELGEKAILRKTGTVEQLITNLLLQENGVELVLQKRVSDGEVGGLKKEKYESFATVRGCFITSDDFDISEGAISGRNSSFQYTDPITFQV